MDRFQQEVAQIALDAAQRHGFALGGGHALMAHGVVRRFTEDVDLFTDLDHGVADAGPSVQAALTEAGFSFEVVEDTGLIYGMDQELVEYEVVRGEEATRLTLAHFDRTRRPVSMDVGPVLHLEDAIGSKMAALLTRAEPRDYVDIAAATRLFTQDELMVLARRVDPSLTDEEVAESMGRLDRLADSVFIRLYGLSEDDVAGLRDAFRHWAR